MRCCSCKAVKSACTERESSIGSHCSFRMPEDVAISSHEATGRFTQGGMKRKTVS